MLNRWTTDKIPNISGKRAIVTGANSGIGFVSDSGPGYLFRTTPVAIQADVDTVWKLVKELGRYNEFSKGEINIQMTGDVIAGNTFHFTLCPNRFAGHFIPRSTEEITLVDDVKHVIRWRRRLPSGDYTERVQLVETLPDHQGTLWHNTMRIPGKIGFFTKKSMGNLIDNAFSKLAVGIKEEAEANNLVLRNM